jgi:hypothetical protein
MLNDEELDLGETGYRIISRFGVDMSDEDSLKVFEKAVTNERSGSLYENIVAHLDELLDSQLTALIEAVRSVQVERETEMILTEAV